MPVIIETPSGARISFIDGTDPQEAVNAVKETFPDEMTKRTFTQKELEQLRLHEGEVRNKEGRHVSYIDSLGNLTGGVGHLMTDVEQKEFPIGTDIPDSVVDKWFNADTKAAEKQANSIIKSFSLEESPDEVKQILFNMVFNLGEGSAESKKGLRGFIDMLPALSRKDYSEAASEMKDSVWFGQVKSRGVDLVSRMNAVAKPLDNPPGVKFNVEVGPLKESDLIEPTEEESKGRN